MCSQLQQNSTCMLAINSAPALQGPRTSLLASSASLLPVLIQGGCFGFQTLITDSPVVFMLSTGGAQQILNQQILNGSGRHRGGAHTRPDKDGNTSRAAPLLALISPEKYIFDILMYPSEGRRFSCFGRNTGGIHAFSITVSSAVRVARCCKPLPAFLG